MASNLFNFIFLLINLLIETNADFTNFINPENQIPSNNFPVSSRDDSGVSSLGSPSPVFPNRMENIANVKSKLVLRAFNGYFFFLQSEEIQKFTVQSLIECVRHCQKFEKCYSFSISAQNEFAERECVLYQYSYPVICRVVSSDKTNPKYQALDIYMVTQIQGKQLAAKSEFQHFNSRYCQHEYDKKNQACQQFIVAFSWEKKEFMCGRLEYGVIESDGTHHDNNCPQNKVITEIFEWQHNNGYLRLKCNSIVGHYLSDCTSQTDMEICQKNNLIITGYSNGTYTCCLIIPKE